MRISTKTILKWRRRTFTNGLSSRLLRVCYALTKSENALAICIRRMLLLPLDEIHEAMTRLNPRISRSSIYRCLQRKGLASRQKEKRQEAKKFKEYAPGFLHIDVTYLPKFNGKRAFLFVGIDRITRVMFYREYSRRNAINSADFLKQCINFFSSQIKYVLTDNGLEFTNRFYKNRRAAKKPSLFDQTCFANGIVQTTPANTSGRSTNGRYTSSQLTLKILLPLHTIILFLILK